MIIQVEPTSGTYSHLLVASPGNKIKRKSYNKALRNKTGYYLILTENARSRSLGVKYAASFSTIVLHHFDKIKNGIY